VGRIDYTGRAGDFRAARTLPVQVAARWTAAVRALDLPAPGPVLDLGAGPGGFLGLLDAWFGPPVLAAEPSPAMRDEARTTGVTTSFPYVAAWAEALPFLDDSFGLAWLSTVVHQFDDRDRAALELARVVRPGGHVLVRGFFSDVPVTGLLADFPGIERSVATFPGTGEVTATFTAAGFEPVGQVDVVEPWSFSLDAWPDRVRTMHHTDSALRPLTDDEIEAGIAAVLTRFGDHDGPAPSPGRLRLLVARRS
jgi:SAM-dependent methyltransferase